MKNKKWISLAAAVILAVTALPMTAFAAEKDGGEEKRFKQYLGQSQEWDINVIFLKS